MRDLPKYFDAGHRFDEVRISVVPATQMKLLEQRHGANKVAQAFGSSKTSGIDGEFFDVSEHRRGFEFVDDSRRAVAASQAPYDRCNRVLAKSLAHSSYDRYPLIINVFMLAVAQSFSVYNVKGKYRKPRKIKSFLGRARYRL